MSTLKVKIESESILLQNNLHVEVRDNNMQLVDSFYGGNEIDVEPGIYQISSVLEDGKKHNKLINVESDQQVDVVLSRPDEGQYDNYRIKSFIDVPPALGNDSSDGDSGLLLENLNKSRELTNINLFDILKTISKTPDLQEYGGVRVNKTMPMSWQFFPDNNQPLQSIPSAEFIVGNKKLSISLPVNPEGYGDESSCVIDFELKNAVWKPLVTIAKQRTVSSTLLNMLNSNQIIRAGNVAEKADELLRGKYQDPVGAVLGALILSKVGLLSRRIDWLRNLARDFYWLPDGRVLLASQLSMSNKRGEEEEALDLLLSAYNKTMLFTESYSMLVNLLRRWPSDAGKDKRQRALDSISGNLASVDWSSSIYTTYVVANEIASEVEMVSAQ